MSHVYVESTVDLSADYIDVRDIIARVLELRDERVGFFFRALGRGRVSVSYELRAETPGRFSALPARALGMYAPELAANSDEFKTRVAD